MSESTQQRWNQIPTIVENPYKTPVVPLEQAIANPGLTRIPGADVPLSSILNPQGN